MRLISGQCYGCNISATNWGYTNSMKTFLSHFMSLNRRDRMLYGITLAAVGVILLGSVADGLTGRYPQAVVQAIMLGVAIGLFLDYRRRRNATVFAYVGIATASLGYTLLLYLDHFVLHSYLILMIIPLVIFFLLPLRQALIVSVLHYLMVALVSVYGYAVLHLDSAMFDKDAIQVYTFGAIFILAFGTFYQLAIEESYRQLQHANAQKALLLKEIHHRIKNNLNKMSSALGLQILRVRQGHSVSPEEILTANKLRIEAMSLVHEALYHSEDIARVDMAAYTRKLLDLIARTHDRTLPVHLKAAEVTLPPDKALRIGTILNELITNTLKHTPVDTPDLRIDITLTPEENSCRLTYIQTGHPDPVDAASLTQTKGLGMMLIRLSAEEMGGNLTIQSEQNTLIFTIMFPC